MESNTGTGLVTFTTPHSVDEAVETLSSLLHAKGITLFALIDHGGEAAKAGLAMPPTRLLIFGDPKAGTPLMLASPSAAIDLPLKILIAEDATGTTQVTYNSPAWLITRHHLPDDLIKNIAAIEVLAAKLTS